MNEPHGSVPLSHGLEDGIRDSVVTPHGQWPAPSGYDGRECPPDVLHGLGEVVQIKRHVTDVSYVQGLIGGSTYRICRSV